MNNNFTGKKIAILGLGLEGVSSVLFLKKKGAEVTVLDQKPEIQIKESLGEISGIRAIGGKNYLNDLTQYDLVVRSPGIKLDTPELVEVRKKGVEITSQIKLFFDLCPCPIIGVTGTKGKGTTSSLIYEMSKKQGKNAYLGGNIGQPPLDFLDKLNEHSIVLLELSSFQLLDLDKSPQIAVMLMTVPEHLDYHKDVYEYIGAKRNLLRFQSASDAAIVNADYPASNESDIHTEAKVFYVSRGKEVEEGCFVKKGKIVLSLRSLSQFDDSSNASVPASRLSSRLGIRPASQDLVKSSSHGKAPRDFNSSEGKNFISSPRTTIKKEIINVNEILLPGEHNYENVCAAVMAAVLAGVSTENIRQVLKTFKGLEHRLELVAEIPAKGRSSYGRNGVKYYDDSFSTTPETAIAAIQAFKDPEILILGGSSKGSDFSELGKVISEAENIKAIIGIGVEWKRIKAQVKVQSSKFKVIEGFKNMHEIVQAAAKIAELGDVVLLSPACASFDMFKNYKDRGDQFKKEVFKLKSSPQI